MFAGRRKELQETVSNWNNNSPNLSRTGSLRNPNENLLSPPRNQLFRSQSTRSSRKLPFFKGNKHGIFNVNSSKNSFTEEKPMKPVYINPKSDAVVMNNERTKATINYSSDALLLSPHLSPIPKDGSSPEFYSPQIGFRPEPDYTEQEMEERRFRRRSRSFSGYTNRSISQIRYPPPPPLEPPSAPKPPATPKRSKSLTRGRTPTRDDHSNSTLNSARLAAQKVQNRQNEMSRSTSRSPLRKSPNIDSNSIKSVAIDPLPQQPISGQTTLKRTQSLKASLQRWGVEHKNSQGQLSVASNATTPTSPIPPVPPLPDEEINSISKKLEPPVTNWNHSSESPLLELARKNSLNKRSLSQKNSFNSKNARKINGKISNDILVSTMNDVTLTLSESKDIAKNDLTRSSSLKNSITENSTLIRKHSYRMSIYSDLDDEDSTDSIENSFIKSAIKEEDVENIVIEEERPIKHETPILVNDKYYEGSPKSESYYEEKDCDKSYKIVEEKQEKRSHSNLYRDRRRATPPIDAVASIEPVKPYGVKETYGYKEEKDHPNDDSRYPDEDSSRYHPDDSRYPDEDSSRYPDDSRRYPDEDSSRYPDDSRRYPEDSRYQEDSRYPEDDSRLKEDSRYPEDDSRYPEDDSRYPEDSRYTEDKEDNYKKHDDKDDYNNKRTTISSYPEDDGVEEVIYATIKTIRSTGSSVSKEFPDITVLSNSDVGYDDISSVATPSLSTVNPSSSFMTNQATSRVYNSKPELSTLQEASCEESIHSKEGERSIYNSDIETDESSPICNPDSILMGETFNDNAYLPSIPSIDGDHAMRRSNSLTKTRKNIVMRPRELFPRSASLRNIRTTKEDNGKLQEVSFLSQPPVEDNQSYDKEKKSVNESLDNLLVQLEKMKNEKPMIENNEANSEEPSLAEGNMTMDDITQADMSFKRMDNPKLIISNLEKKAPEPVWVGGTPSESDNTKLNVEKNNIDTKSIHIETEDAFTEFTDTSRYTESKITSEPESIPRVESPVKEVTPKSSIEVMIKRNDSPEVKSLKSSISNSIQRSSSGHIGSISKPVSIIHEREKKNGKVAYPHPYFLVPHGNTLILIRKTIVSFNHPKPLLP